MVTNVPAFSRHIRGREHHFQEGELVMCWKSGYFVIDSFFTQTNDARVYARVKKIYKTKEAMRRPSSYTVRAESLIPVSVAEVESMFAIESERARTKYNTLIGHAKN